MHLGGGHQRLLQTVTALVSLLFQIELQLELLQDIWGLFTVQMRIKYRNLTEAAWILFFLKVSCNYLIIASLKQARIRQLQAWAYLPTTQ